MIGKLSGTVDSIHDDTVILDVGGVGYLVQCPSSTLSRLSVGAHASLMIDMKVSDDAIKLYGFASAEEREWFRLLQTVQNVGGKVALSVLSTLSPRDLQRALALSDKAMIGRAPGVGPKLALRIATELKDKAAHLMAGGMMRDGGEGHAPVTAPRGPAADAVTALVKLGYSEGQAAEAVARAANDLGLEGDNAETGVLLREALRGMAR
jgi:Holliday junction DNA helicase RuvA